MRASDPDPEVLLQLNPRELDGMVLRLPSGGEYDPGNIVLEDESSCRLPPDLVAVAADAHRNEICVG